MNNVKSVVSAKGQTVIPKEIRDALGIKEGTKLHWDISKGRATLFVIPDDPIAAAMGALKGSTYTFEDFMEERNAERARERALEEREKV